MLLNASCKSGLVLVKMYTVDHFLCKSFLSHDHNDASPVDAINVKLKFTPLRSLVSVVQSPFRYQRVSVLKGPLIFIVNTGLPPNVCNVVSRINPTHSILKVPQDTHTAVFNHPTCTSCLCHKRFRSNHQSVLRKKMFLEISQNSQENICVRVCFLIKKENLVQVFSCEFCKISNDTFFTEHLWTTAFEVYQVFLDQVHM